MKIGLDWLKEYIDLDLDAGELDHLLTMRGLEIEARERVELSRGKTTEVFELNITPNRGYCLSHIGVARELASLMNTACHLPNPCRDLETTWGSIPVNDRISVENEAADLCPRYTAMVIENVTPGPSPQWLADRLLAVGLRPINNIVDITNFVMMEYGQPLHAFDHALLAGHKIVIRRARPDEPFLALDGSELKLGPSALVVADAEKPVALAGIIGGANSQVTERTRTVALESACFDPVTVRKGSRKYNIRTDSSYRFERGVDIEAVVTAQSRAALLIHELAGGTLCKGRIDVYPEPLEGQVIRVRVDHVNKTLGAGFSPGEIEESIRQLGFKVDPEKSGNSFHVRVPAHRPALAREIDLIEDLARLKGYDSFATAKPVVSIHPVRFSPKQECVRRIRGVISHSGYSETINYSFIGATEAARYQSAFGGAGLETIALANPISADLSTMRPSLIPSLLKTAVRNFSKGQKPVKIFELGRVFLRRKSDAKILEKTAFTLLAAGPYEKSIWKDSGGNYDFYDVKGALETVFAQLKLDLEYQREEWGFLAPGKSVTCLVNGKAVGFMGELPVDGSPPGQKVLVAEIDLDHTVQCLPGRVQYHPIPKYPETLRDISLLVDKAIPSVEISRAIADAGSPLLGRVELYDHYEGKKLEEGKKSLTFALSFISSGRTLTDEEVNPVFENIVQTLGVKYGATLREA